MANRYSVGASVTINAVDFTDKLVGNVNVRLRDSSAGRFSFSLVDSTVVPVQGLNTEVVIGFNVTDGTGSTVSFNDVIKGQIGDISFNETTRVYNVSGYDYGAVHRTNGNLVSADINTINTDTILLDSQTTFNTGQVRIFGVSYIGTKDNIVDGVDYFVDSKQGIIHVPLGSNLITNPEVTDNLEYKYPTFFATHKALIEEIVGLKGWTAIAEDANVTLADYSAITEQPVITLSNESIIDEANKHFEISGAKARTHQFPIMSVYSPTENFNGAENHVITEADWYHNSLNFQIDDGRLLTRQTVKSVAKSSAEIDIGASEVITEQAGDVATDSLLTVLGTWWPGTPLELSEQSAAILADAGQKDAVVIKISKRNINSVSLVATGTLLLRIDYIGDAAADILYPPVTLDDTDWTITTDEEDIILTLSLDPVGIDFGTGEWVGYPLVDAWTLEVSAQKINYDEGNVESTIEATVDRPVGGVDLLEGEIIEHPYCETSTHCGNVGTGVLTKRGNIYKMNCRIPLFKTSTYLIGEQLKVSRSSSTMFKGVIDGLDMNVNVNTARAFTNVSASGVGLGI